MDLDLRDARPIDKVPDRRERISLRHLLSLNLYMPQETCKDILSLLDLPKLVRLGIGHEKVPTGHRATSPSAYTPVTCIPVGRDNHGSQSRLLAYHLQDWHNRPASCKIPLPLISHTRRPLQCKEQLRVRTPRMGRKPYYADDSEGDAGSFPERGYAVIPGTGFVNVL